MRSVYLRPEDQFWQGDHKLYRGEKVGYLTKVLRLKPGEKVIIFDGLGHYFKTKLEKVERREVVFTELEKYDYAQSYDIGVLIALTKKEALERSLRIAVELGVRSIYLSESEFSQRSFEWKDRHNLILESAMEQSNHFYKPKITILKSIQDLGKHSFENIWVLSTERKAARPEKRGRDLLCFGPEAGWSERDLSYLEGLGGKFWQIESPIMRAPTAISAGLASYLTLTC